MPGRSCILLTLLTAAATPVALAQPEVPTVADRSAAFVATTPEFVARVARSAGDPGFEPYAKRQGLFGTAFRGYLEPIERHWEPYLDGEADLSAAMAALVAAIPVEGE